MSRHRHKITAARRRAEIEAEFAELLRERSAIYSRMAALDTERAAIALDEWSPELQERLTNEDAPTPLAADAMAKVKARLDRRVGGGA